MTARRLLGRFASRVESIFLRRDDLIPPLHLRWSYYRTARRDGFRRFAAAAAHELISRGLRPDHAVLDVGSGIGPLALGLVPHLTEGRYEGLDIHAEAVRWCQNAITPRHPRFRFRHADLFSTAYNPRGALRACDYTFPFDAGAFDFVFLGSVCTHLPGAETAHYLREVSRVLRRGGRCVVSFYLLDEASLEGLASGTSFLAFHHAHGDEGSRVVDPSNPELAIAHPEGLVRRRYADAGLAIADVRRGSWWAGTAHEQDVLTAVKE